MSKRLSKISRELNVGISTIVAFLNSNGYSCEEDPSEKISEEIAEYVRNNIKAYLLEIGGNHNLLSTKQKNTDILKTIQNVPLELKIIETANKKKKVVERIVGFTDYDWHYTVLKFKGECSQPVKFTLFDEVICKLLLKEQMSEEKIGTILGLDIKNDPAERNILKNAIKELRKDNMVEGDESIYWLTDIGKKYAANGEKYSTYTKNFELYIDNVGDVKRNAKAIFSSLISEKQTTFKRENLPNNIEEVKPIAELQAPEIHYPDKNYLLQTCEINGYPEGYICKVWVVLLQDFRNNDYRILVYDEKSGTIIDELSEALSKLDTQKQFILEKLLKESENDESPVIATNEEKQEEQIQNEQDLITKQEEIEQALADANTQKAEEIQKEIVNSKRHFNSVEFEIELKHLFEETNGEMWIISPWIKNATYKRIPFFEQYLKKGGKIFVAYSEPENEGDIMALEGPYSKLMELDAKYQNFYIHQLPPFHYKRVWLRQENCELYYTGSYNILSFFVKQGMQNYRQEEMTKILWDKEEDTVYINILMKFAEKYFNQTFEKLNDLCNQPLDKSVLKSLNLFSFNKLKPFIGKGEPILDEKYQELISTKEKNIKLLRQSYYDKEITLLLQETKELALNLSVSYENKRALQGRLNTLDNEFPEMMETLQRQEVISILSKIRTSNPDRTKNIKSKFKR